MPPKAPRQVPLIVRRLDQAAARMGRRRGPLDLALGEVLDRLFLGERLLQLGYAREVDYARERLGIPPRTMYRWLRLARGLADKPLLRRAVRLGAVTPRKALAILPVATGHPSVRGPPPRWRSPWASSRPRCARRAWSQARRSSKSRASWCA